MVTPERKTITMKTNASTPAAVEEIESYLEEFTLLLKTLTMILAASAVMLLAIIITHII